MTKGLFFELFAPGVTRNMVREEFGTTGSNDVVTWVDPDGTQRQVTENEIVALLGETLMDDTSWMDDENDD